ncbi:MAG: hypothetical protein R3E97_02490 [Candidatus Eisenbacteria bacterium]
MSPRPPRLDRFWMGAVVLVTSVAAVAILAHLVGLIQANPIPFDTDEADHANAGLELYRAFARSPSAVFSAITRQAFYPPVNSVCVALAYAVGGPSLLASRLCSVVQFAAFLGALFLLVRRGIAENDTSSANLTSSSPDLTRLQAGDSSVSHGASSPPDLALSTIAASFAVLAAASSPVAFLNALLIMLEPTGILLGTLLLLLLLRREPRPILLGVVLTLIMLTKYSFGIVVVPATLAAVVLEPEGTIRERIRKVFPTAATFGILMLAWVLVTDRHAMWHFFVGHPSYVPFLSWENLTFHVRAWFVDYTVHPVVAALVFVFALFAVRRRLRQLAVRAALLTILFALVILTISTTNETRHLMVIVPSAFFLGGLGLHDALVAASKRAPFGFAPAAGAGAALVLGLVFGSFRLVATIDPEAVIYFEGEPEFLALEEFLLDEGLANGPILVAGATDQLGVEAIRFLAAARGGVPYTAVRIDSYPFREKRIREDRLRKRNVVGPYFDESRSAQLGEVLNSGYYGTAVQIEPLTPSEEADTSIENVLGDHPHEEMSAAGFRVCVYPLAPIAKLEEEGTPRRTAVTGLVP